MTWWLVSRSAGIVALLAMTVSVVLGLLMANRVVKGRRPAALHEQLSLTALGALALHAEALLGDHWLHPGLAGITVPFAIGYRPLAVAAGIVGGYLAALLGLSFYARRRFGARRWRQLHRFTVVAWGMAVVHALTAGTDAALLRIPVLASAGVVVALLSARLLGTRSGSRRSSTPRTTVSARSPG